MPRNNSDIIKFYCVFCAPRNSCNLVIEHQPSSSEPKLGRTAEMLQTCRFAVAILGSVKRERGGGGEGGGGSHNQNLFAEKHTQTPDDMHWKDCH